MHDLRTHYTPERPLPLLYRIARAVAVFTFFGACGAMLAIGLSS
jgi:hypothetical protein